MKNTDLTKVGNLSLPIPRTGGEQDLYAVIKGIAAIGTGISILYLMLYFGNNLAVAKR
jgi:hypothetical protein